MFQHISDHHNINAAYIIQEWHMLDYTPPTEGLMVNQTLSGGNDDESHSAAHALKYLLHLSFYILHSSFLQIYISLSCRAFRLM